MAWQANAHTLVSLKVAELWWSSALRDTALTLSKPDNPAAPQVLAQTATVNARDQTVAAVGVAHTLDSGTTLYAGFNYGRNPIPLQNLTPLIAAIGEGHLTGGFAAPVAPGWIISGAFEYLLRKTVSYINLASPLGPREGRSGDVALHCRLGRRC